MRHLKGIDFSSSLANRKMGYMQKEILLRFVKYAAIILPFVLIFYTILQNTINGNNICIHQVTFHEL